MNGELEMYYQPKVDVRTGKVVGAEGLMRWNHPQRYSSLAYLHRLPIKTIKIDPSLVKEIQYASGHYPVVLAVISVARGHGLNLIAAGVETECQARYLEQAGCTTMQGHLFHKALTASQLAQQLEARS